MTSHHTDHTTNAATRAAAKMPEVTAQTAEDKKVVHLGSEDCIFCKIVSGEIPAMKIYEDEHTLAFLDIQPVSHGHALVISKDHFENMYTTPGETWCRVMLTVKELGTAIRNAVNADGINLRMNNERAAGQLVPHTHVHIIPRHNDDGLEDWHGKAYKDAGEAENIVSKIRKELEA